MWPAMATSDLKPILFCRSSWLNPASPLVCPCCPTTEIESLAFAEASSPPDVASDGNSVPAFNCPAVASAVLSPELSCKVSCWAPRPTRATPPGVVPQLRIAVKELLDRKKHPFYANAEAEFFLARQDGKVVGRIAAIVNRDRESVG